jgi:hypothetical protein
MNENQADAPSLTSRASEFVGKTLKLAQKQAELATLNTVTLPKLYHAVGKHLMSAAKLPPDLEQRRVDIRQLEAQSGAAQGLEEAREPSEAASGFAAKAAQLAQQAARKAAKATGDAARSAQVQAGYVALGKAAAEKYGEKALPPEERQRYAALSTRREQLMADVAAIGKRSGTKTAFRFVAFLALLAVMFGGGRVVRSWYAGTTTQQRADGKPVFRPTAQDEQGASGRALPSDTNTIKALTVEQAEWLARHYRNLYLEGLTSLSPEVAVALARHNGDLQLNGLTTLSDSAAEALSRHNNGSLYLSGISTLSDNASASLMQHAGHLALGLNTLSDRAADVIGNRVGSLSLGGLAAISDQAAERLAGHVGHLWLNSLTTLSDKAAASLSQHTTGDVFLEGVTTLSDKAAKTLRANPGVHLPDKFGR